MPTKCRMGMGWKCPLSDAPNVHRRANPAAHSGASSGRLGPAALGGRSNRGDRHTGPALENRPTRPAYCFPTALTLIEAVGLREQEPRLCSWWPDDDPTLRASVVGPRGRVLDEIEAQRVHEEADRLVVVLDDQSGALEIHSSTVDRLRTRQSRRVPAPDLATAGAHRSAADGGATPPPAHRAPIGASGAVPQRPALRYNPMCGRVASRTGSSLSLAHWKKHRRS